MAIPFHPLQKAACWLVLWLLAAPLSAGAASPVYTIQPGSTQHQLGSHIDYLRDPSGALTLEQVRALPEERWRPNGRDSVNLGFTQDWVWVRVKLRNLSPQTGWILDTENPWLREADLYLLNGSQVETHLTAGQLIPPEDKQEPSIFSQFQLNLSPNQERWVYLRSQNPGSFYLNPVLLTPTAMALKSGMVWALFGGYGGLVLVMVFYNLLLGLNLLDRKYLYYTFYIFCTGLMVLTLQGIFNPLLLAAYSQAEADFIGRMVSILVVVHPMALLWFIQSFLEISVKTPRLGRYTKGWLFLLGGAGLLSLLFPISWVFPVLDGLFMLTHLITLGLTALFLRRGYRPARYLLLAEIPNIIGMLIGAVAYTGLINASLITLNAGGFGSALEIVLFSLALADRYNLLRQEKERALSQALEHETLAVKRLKENVELRQAQAAAEAARTEALRAKERAEEATALKDKFVSLVAHDIRSPFSSIMTVAEMLHGHDHPPLSGEQKEMVDIIRSKGRRFMQMVEGLLNLNRLQTGKMVPQKEPLQPWLLGEEVMMLKHLADMKEIRIQNQIPPSLTVEADGQLIYEVLQNLVSNAIKFCRPQDTITLLAHPQIPACLGVADTGTGVDPVFLDKLFNPEEKTTSPGTSGEQGSGMGLPLCAEIMAAHGGKIWVESKPGEGATFWLALPHGNTSRD